MAAHLTPNISVCTAGHTADDGCLVVAPAAQLVIGENAHRVGFHICS
jgi:hypothetical protein